MTKQELDMFRQQCAEARAKVLEYKKIPSLWTWFKNFLVTRALTHKRAPEAQRCSDRIEDLMTSTEVDDDFRAKQNELIMLLNEKRFALSTLSKSNLLREKIQEALEEALVSSLHYQKKSIPKDYLDSLELMQHTFQSAFYTGGDFVITGLLIEWFGTQFMMKRALNKIKSNLDFMLENHLTAGFLSEESINEYEEKISLMLKSIDKNELEQEAQVKYARSLLEDIQNAAGVISPYQAKYKEHEPLIKSCFWYDEMFKLAQAKLEAQHSAYL